MKKVILTFDDAVVTQLDAVPILKEYKFGATFYINRFEESGTSDPDRPRLCATDLKMLVTNGFELGNHSLTHPYMSKLDDPDTVAKEIDGIEQLFANTGLPKPETFAYPWGPSNKYAIQILQERGYLAGRICVPRCYIPDQDPVMEIPCFSIKTILPNRFQEAIASDQENGAIVILYHGIPDVITDFSSTLDEFKMHMKFLKDNGYQVTGLAEYMHSQMGEK